METKDYSLRVKAVEDSGQFTAWAARYGEIDLQGDVIEKGAFTRSINEMGAAGVPLLWSHNQAEPVGTAKLVDQERGPIVEGQIDITDPSGRLAYDRLRKGLARGVSIGFLIPNRDGVRYDAEGVRHITELKLMELSLVAIPAQPSATIISVKSLADAATLLNRCQCDGLGAPEYNALQTIQKAVQRLLATVPAPEVSPVPDSALLADLKSLAALLPRPN